MSLARDGYEVLAERMDMRQLIDIRAHLLGCDVFDAHVQAKAKQRAPAKGVIGAGRWPMCCHAMHDVLRAPGFLRLVLGFTERVREILGEPPLLYSVNAMWTQPAQGRYGQTHGWHRDGDDRKFVALFIYGDQVSRREEGAHRYLPGSHLDPEAPTPADVEARAVDILGEPGTMFLENPRGLHQGVRPSRPRLLLWARWGVSEPPQSYLWDKLSPAPRDSLPWWPASEEEARLIRLVAR